MTDEIERYFDVCGFAPDDLIAIGTKAAGAPGPKFQFYEVRDAPRQLSYRPHGADVWISANPMRRPIQAGSRGTAEDVVAVRALWADIDVGPGKMPSFQAAEELIRQLSEALDCLPAVVVMTGHGLQPRWRLSGDSDDWTDTLARFGRMVKWYANGLGGDVDNVYDLPRILRAPGTVNNKDPESPVAVQVKFPLATLGTVAWDDLVDLVEPYVEPEPKPVAPKAESVDTARGDAYVARALGYMAEELSEVQQWAPGQTNERGYGWEKITADAAYRLAEFAKAEWCSLSDSDARGFLLEHAPTDSGWTKADVAKKWEAQYRRAEPAAPPVERTYSDDPLDDNYRAESVPPDDDQRAERVGPQWRKYSWDDQGNAERIVARYGRELKFIPALDRWLRYVNGAWVEDKLGGQWAAAKLFDELPRLESDLYSDEEYKPTPNSQPTSQRAEFFKFCAKQRFTSKHKAAADAVKNSHALDATTAEFDRHPLLLNCANGVVDLQTGELWPHDPELKLRRQAPVAFDSNAECPDWEKFLQRVMPVQANRDYLQRIVGYSITGSTGEQSLFIHHGPPAAGKSVFLRILEAILGPELSRVIPPTTLLAKRVEQHPTDISGLEGRRVLQMSEVPQGARLDEAVVKRMTGEETITARGMNQDFRDFRIVGKVHIAANDLPRISDDRATHRRIHVVPWTVEIPPHERDTGLGDRIMASELPGVLAWAVRGALMWLQDRLDRPEEAEKALAAYIEEEDELGEWIRERLIITGEGQAWTSNDEIYRHYRQWADAAGIAEQFRLKRNTLAKKLAARGMERYRSKTARGFYVVPVAPVRFGGGADPLS